MFTAIQAEINRSREMLDFPDDWDDEGAKPISRDAWDRAVALLDGLAEPVPRILPGPEGGVDLHWTGRRELLIHIPGDSGAPRYYGDNGSGRDKREGEIVTEEDRLALLAWLKRGSEG